jgi:hypothetical protein
MAPTFKLIRGVFCLAAFVVVSSSLADVVELKTGERLQGTFRQATSAGVVIEVGGESINMPLAKVRAIYFGPVPAETATQISLAGEALQALEALQSVTSSGVNYQEYARRVLDAKVKVDQYLKSPGQDDQRVRSAIGMAMRCYEVASQAWNLKIAGTAGSVFRHVDIYMVIGRFVREELRECPAMREWLSANDAELPRSLNDDWLKGLQPGDRQAVARMFETGISISKSPSAIWPCASEKIAEGKRQLASQK